MSENQVVDKECSAAIARNKNFQPVVTSGFHIFSGGGCIGNIDGVDHLSNFYKWLNFSVPADSKTQDMFCVAGGNAAKKFY